MPNLNLKVPAIEKLIDYTASGVGAIAGPMLAPWKASREAKARLVAAPIEAQVRRIEAESEAETLQIIAKAQSEARQYVLEPGAEVHGRVGITRDDISQRIEFQERKRLSNISAVVRGAADELEDKEAPEHEPDHDWTARFFNDVQDVSSEDMQKIWAKILAGEVESPGRTSLRTLDILRNMTKRDAEMFKDMCEYVMNNDFVFYDDSVKDINALKYNNLLHLQDCGLVNVRSDLLKNFEWINHEYITLPHKGETLMITSGRKSIETLKIPAIRLTAIGHELSRFIESTLDVKYLREFSRFLKSQDCELSYLEEVQESPDGILRYEKRIPIEPDSEQSGGNSP